MKLEPKLTWRILGKDHTPFMDYANAQGLKVIFPLIGDNTLLANTPDDDFMRLLRNQVSKFYKYLH